MDKRTLIINTKHINFEKAMIMTKDNLFIKAIIDIIIDFNYN